MPVPEVKPINNQSVTPTASAVGSQETAAPPAPGPSPPPSPVGGGGSNLLNYDPTKPVFAGPETAPEVGPGANFQQQVTQAYNQNSPLIEASRNRALERFAGTGMIHSDIASRAGEGAAMDKAMQMVAPDVQLQQDFLRSQQGYDQQRGLSEQRFGYESKLSEQQYGQQRGLSEQQYGQQLELNEQINRFDKQTQERLHGFQKETNEMMHGFQKELTNLNFSNNMEAALLSSMQNMIGNGTQQLTSLAMSPDATAEEVNNIRDSIINGLRTFTNIWKGSTGSTDSFDFTGIGG